ncbi:alpha/beta hydrolase [Corynebacterium flavescens]|uniref:Uncharacterized protein n=1 Tax=Corynebacterium flavescens TaxID=28028 RepID=A0A1L7CK35_CORFL|nr:alpha/beta hydrolase family protein [Corynebacterium flavescens]APT86169.1 hypothetical protein CFLV_02495 [Corynebacterium flavescens]KAA8724435.1 esterase family protein [Corynebacterium flavescens]GEB97281.1 hypothetical protein CFL01nite_07760 [Corynebacterium flavescens]
MTQQPRHRLRKRVLGVVAALALVTPGVAHAQESTSSLLTDPELRDLIQFSSQSPLSSGYNLHFTLSSLNAIGSSDLLPGSMSGIDPYYPRPTKEGIEKPEVIDRGAPDGAGIERWVVASPSMKRDVVVQIRKSPTGQPAPMLYLLDGIDAPEHTGMINPGRIQETLAHENVTLVMPTEARASMFYDWESYDENLGLSMWETFMTKELAPLLEEEIPFNGKRGVGGISMGAGGALNLINRNPEMFDAAIGVSGCYSNSDPIGEQTQNAIVQSRGGSVKNMVGEKGSPAWKAHDVAADVSNLTNKSIYLSSANGSINAEDAEYYQYWNPKDIFVGIILEQGSYYCTKRLEQELNDAGATATEVVYDDHGGHNWKTFQPHLALGWEHIKPALES